MLDYRRTHDCGTLRKKDVGATVTLSGWVHRRRDHGGLIFVDLRDRYGLTQLVFDPDKDPTSHALAEKIRLEWVITVRGTVIPRSEGMANANLATGDIEVEVTDFNVLSRAKTPPFSVSDDTITVSEDLRLKYRYLDIRRGDVMDKLIVRHKTTMATRRYMDGLGFLEIGTPFLAKSTPEGARDYLVPSRVYPGTFYALPQSPQLFKQLLMVAGMDRYFQIVQCFRDEDLRADRQPEFTQIDIEMSFGKPEDIMKIIEGLIATVFLEAKGIKIQTPFRHLTHAHCMEKYGTDRPDLRFGMEFFTLNDIAEQSDFSVFKEQRQAGGVVKGFCVKGGADISRRSIELYTEFVSQFGVKGLAWMKYQDDGLSSSIVKFFTPEQQQEIIKRTGMEKGDLILMVADHLPRTNMSLDHLRRHIAKERNLIAKDRYEFVWVDDFPLFSWDEKEGRIQSEHHPFTAPHPDDEHLLDSDPLKVRSLGYDIVLNGYEIGGGSQRIHSSELQHKLFERLNLTHEEIEAKFGFFIEAMSYGAPPHLGIALGLDRLVMLLTGTENIRDVIAFPKTQKASDLMLDCPSEVSPEQLSELKLSLETLDKGGKLPC